MMISQREATFRLSTAARPRLTARLAEGVLVSGFAGPSTKLPGITLYDADAVQRLAESPVLTSTEVPVRCPSGLFVVRSAARPGVAQLPPEEKLRVASGAFDLSVAVRLNLSLLLERHGFVGVLVTIASYVLATAGITGATLEPGTRRPRTRLALSPAGDWGTRFHGTRLMTPPGNRWILLPPTDVIGGDGADQLRGTR